MIRGSPIIFIFKKTKNFSNIKPEKIKVILKKGAQKRAGPENRCMQNILMDQFFIYKTLDLDYTLIQKILELDWVLDQKNKGFRF